MAGGKTEIAKSYKRADMGKVLADITRKVWLRICIYHEEKLLFGNFKAFGYRRNSLISLWN